MTEERFNIQQQYREKFYQLPKVFFTNEKYMQLSNDAKIAYALLKDRLELSIKNNWFDDNGDIFFIFTNEKLKKILNVHNTKLGKIKKELSESGLLDQIRCGQGKPNKLYLKNPSITKDDIYEIKNQEEIISEPCHDNDVPKSDFKKSQNRISRNPKIESLEISKSDTNDTDLSNTDLSNTEFSDTNDMNDISETKSENTKPNHTNHTNHLKQQSDEEALKELELQEMPEQVKRYMNNFSVKEVKIIKSVILKAKRSFNDLHNEVYMLEDMDNELLTVLKRFKGTMVKKQERVEAMQGYLMRCILSELEEMHSTNMRRKNFENSPLNIFNY
ncbi:replication protein [Staphylococcus sp. HMSC034G07]|uniref:replication initiator protein A n=1 Tax=Staphylococcus sp. HMSC034G07 TaxID=1715065 RepID=UPI0008AA4EDE|nr:replication initiator protein A [Staphylococcus sp. HMSC034G07]OHO42551.1 replication protein [Staphylococcus sp. HMSC034G07]